MAARSAGSSCLKSITRSVRLNSPSIRPFHVSQWIPASSTATPASKPGDPTFKKPSLPASGIVERVSKALRGLMPGMTEPYVAHGITQELYNECVNRAAYIEGMELSESARFWYEVCKRKPTFSSWAQVTVLHMWMLVVRIRAFEPDNVQTWQQHLVDHFFYDSEGKMTQLTSAQQRKKYLKDLYSQYRGMIAGFDEGLVKGDAVLSTAIWRNVFDANPDIDVELLALVTSYVRRVISGLDRVSDDIIYTGKIKFGMPMSEEPLVACKSKYLEEVTRKRDI